MRKRWLKVRKSGRRKPDYLILGLVLGLTVFGVLMVYDASAATAFNTYQDQGYFLKLQLKWAVGGLGLGGLAYLMSEEFWRKWARWGLGLTIGLLVAVLVPGLGVEHLGARRWLMIGGMGFQPSEILKVTLVVYLASRLEKEWDLKKFVIPVGLILGLVVIEPDLSTAVIVGLAAWVMYWAAGAPIWQMIGLLVATAIGGGVLTLIEPYRVSRLLTFWDPARDPLGSSYHARQILIALGSGGWTGVGWGQSRQKYAYLPAAATDSIFAVIGEEMGFVGAVVVIGVLGLLIVRGLRAAGKAEKRFSRLLGVGLCSWMGIQVLINLAAVVVLIPVTGVPLPLISYGGSSLLVALTSWGIILRISRRGREG